MSYFQTVAAVDKNCSSGYVDFVDQKTAESAGLVSQTNGQVYIGYEISTLPNSRL
jgi:hypothetical protein